MVESGRNRGVLLWGGGCRRGQGAKPRVLALKYLLQAHVEHGHPNVDEPVPTHGLFLGHALITRLTIDSPPSVEMRWPEAVTLRIVFRARGGVEAGSGRKSG
jgi:hypothetical protein